MPANKVRQQFRGFVLVLNYPIVSKQLSLEISWVKKRPSLFRGGSSTIFEY